MNKYYFLIVLGLCSAISCKNKERSSSETNELEKKSITSSVKPVQSDTFDMNKIPLTTQNPGEFPYFSAPESYGYHVEKTKEYEEKLFFYNDSLTHKVTGKYYHTRILPENVEFEETYIVNNYKKIIEKLGGIEIYSGPLDKTYSKVTDENLPYLKDLYDPYAYKYKQFVIRTPHENIWIELIHGLNTDMIDFTVMKEEIMKETVKIIQADDIQKELNDRGKATLYINFDIDKSTLKPDVQQIADEISKKLNNNMSLKLSIEGHTDNTGSEEHNKELSLQRAETILTNLLSKGITPCRVKAQGFGSEKPPYHMSS